MNFLVIDDVHPVLIDRLQSGGHIVDYFPEIKPEDIYRLLIDYQGLIVRSKINVDASWLDKGPNLRLIGRAGAGLDNIDIEEANKRGIEVIHAAEGNADAVAEHTLGLILCLLNKINTAHQSIREGNWLREPFRGEELKRKTVGILGYGNMGQAVAKRLIGFGCRIVAYDKYLESFPDWNAEKVDFETFQSETEILTIHLPLTSETRGMIDKAFLQSFQKSLIFIHTSRGPIVPVSDLVDALLTKKVRFAGLDVLENEPPIENFKKISAPYQTLFDLDQVILTPHVAGWSLESYQKISLVLAQKIEGYISSLPN